MLSRYAFSAAWKSSRCWRSISVSVGVADGVALAVADGTGVGILVGPGSGVQAATNAQPAIAAPILTKRCTPRAMATPPAGSRHIRTPWGHAAMDARPLNPQDR